MEKRKTKLAKAPAPQVEAKQQSELVSNQDVSPDPSYGGGSGNDGIEGRLRQLENKITRLETKLEHIPTKEDLEGIKTLIAEKDAKNTKWMISIISAALIAVVIALIRTFL